MYSMNEKIFGLIEDCELENSNFNKRIEELMEEIKKCKESIKKNTKRISQLMQMLEEE